MEGTNQQYCFPGGSNGDKLDQKVESIMISKFSLLVGIIAFFIPIICFLYNIELNISLIKQNHEAHMEAALEKIANLEKQELDLEKKLDTDHEAIIILMEKIK